MSGTARKGGDASAAASALPVQAVLPALRTALRAHRRAVLQAPPGAGKTTLVPPALLGEGWLAGRRILVLEPRRLAARAAALRMARLRGEQAGQTIGYRVRMETRIGPATRIEVVTEGILTRMLLHDATLDGVGLVIFDEFHERSVHSDLGLALALHTQSLVRDDLRLLVMSATLDGARVAAFLGDAPVVASEGRVHPVEVRYAPPRSGGSIESGVAAAVRAALRDHEGGVLAFLPGAKEIRRVAASLHGDPLPGALVIAPLYGDLPPDAQDLAIAPCPPGQRKVVLATSIAETSLTIEDVRVVIDSGWSRVPRFSPATGMGRLETVRVSRAAAEQRRGRAGRLAPGVCYRLWAEHEQHHLVPDIRPEILEADLAPLALDLAAAGVRDAAELRWLDPPPAPALAQARELLVQLDALDGAGGLTAHGRALARLALHPRLAHMLLAAAARSPAEGALAAAIAALLAARDPLRGPDGADADFRRRAELLAFDGAPRDRAASDDHAVRRAREEAKVWRERLGLPRSAAFGSADVERSGALLALAYPDRLAQRRPGQSGRFLLRNGRGATLPPDDAIAPHDFLAIAHLDDRQRDARIFLAAPISLADVRATFGHAITAEEAVEWDARAAGVRAFRRERLGALVLDERASVAPDEEQVAGVLLAAIRSGAVSLPWTNASRALLRRIACLRTIDESWPDLSEQALMSTLDDWLRPRLAGLRRADDVARLDLGGLIAGTLTWKQRAALDDLAPTHLQVPSGSRIVLDYADPAAPVLAVRLQEMFGATESPHIAGGRVPVVLHLLSPAHRPVQITRDLAGFWRSSYRDVRKDLRGRYPKHAWPEDPLAAAPTHRAKRRG